MRTYDAYVVKKNKDYNKIQAELHDTIVEIVNKNSNKIKRCVIKLATFIATRLKENINT